MYKKTNPLVERELTILQSQAENIILTTQDAGVLSERVSEREAFVSIFKVLIARDIDRLAYLEKQDVDTA